jgi:hypothetical protein
MSISKNEIGLYETEIDGDKYEFEKWGAEDASDVLLDIITIVGQPLGMGAAALFGKDEDGVKGIDRDMDPDIIGKIMESLTGNVGKNKLVVKSLLKKLSTDRVQCNSKPIASFNIHYRDKLFHMTKVVRAGLEVQFGNFFDAVLGQNGIKVPKGIINRDLRTSNGATGAQ